MVTLDLYLDLVALPKGHDDDEQDDLGTPGPDGPLDSDVINEHGHKKPGRGVKALARKKVRQILDSKAGKGVAVVSVASPAEMGTMTPDPDREEGSERKKQKLDGSEAVAE